MEEEAAIRTDIHDYSLSILLANRRFFLITNILVCHSERSEESH
jgi:hypothetical protein